MGLLKPHYSFEEAGMVYEMFLRFDTGKQDETNILRLIRLGSFITDSFNFLSRSIYGTEIIFMGRSNVPSGVKITISKKGSDQKNNVFGRGSKNPQMSTENFRNLFYSALSLLL